MKSSFGLISFAAACALTGSCLAQTWGTYQGSNSHNGFVPITVSPANFSLAWQSPSPHGLSMTQPSGGDGKVFVSENGYFEPASMWAVDGTTGATLWTKDYDNIFSVNPPAYANGRVYFQTGNHASDTYLRCYDSNGAFVFRVPHSAQWEHYLAPTIADGTVYVNGGTYGGMYAFGANDGSPGWFNNQLPQYDNWTPTVEGAYAYTYIGESSFLSGDGGVLAVNRTTGVIDFGIADAGYEWNGWSMNQALALSNGFGYVTQANRLISFNLAGHSIAWQVTRNFSGQPSVSGNTIYVADAGTLAAFSTANGAFIWAWEAPSGNIVGPIVVTNNVAFVSTETATYAVDLTTHNQVWSFAQAGQKAIADGRLYIAGSSTLTAINLGLQRTVAGSVNLQGLSPQAVAGTQVTIQIRAVGSTTALETKTVTLDASGNYSFGTSLPSGNYDFAAKAIHWLRQKQGNRTIGTSGLTGLAFSLTNGDVNGDNAVTLGDFALLRAAFGSSPGDGNWNPNADLNGDGAVTLGDFALLRASFGSQGDQ